MWKDTYQSIFPPLTKEEEWKGGAKCVPMVENSSEQPTFPTEARTNAHLNRKRFPKLAVLVPLLLQGLMV